MLRCVVTVGQGFLLKLEVEVMNAEKKLRLMKLAGLMRAARNQFSESHKVFEYLCELEGWYSTECHKRDYVIEDIIASVGAFAFLMFDKVYP